ncbi:MAG: SEL1-like repeat protein [Bacteroidota bacterium]
MHQSVLERLSQEVNPTPLHPCSFRDRHADVLIAGLPVWQAAAERSFAQYVLGVVHDDGTGVTQSDTKAVSWYRKAGEQGNSDAEIALARLSR